MLLLPPQATTALIWRNYRGAFSSFEQQEQHIDLLSGKTVIFGFILNAADKIAGDGLEKLPFDVAFAPVSSPQSLEYPHSILH